MRTDPDGVLGKRARITRKRMNYLGWKRDCVQHQDIESRRPSTSEVNKEPQFSGPCESVRQRQQGCAVAPTLLNSDKSVPSSALHPQLSHLYAHHGSPSHLRQRAVHHGEGHRREKRPHQEHARGFALFTNSLDMPLIPPQKMLVNQTSPFRFPMCRPVSSRR